MKSILNLLGVLLICTTASFAQVGIGTENPDSSSILDLESTDKGLLLPRLTTGERDLISSPADGLTIYNTTTESLEVYTGSIWKRLTAEEETAPSLTMYTGSAGTMSSTNGNFYNLPVGSAEIQANNTDYFNVVGDGEIEILKAGSYLINASWSTSNLRSGSTKYILAVFVDNVRVAYLSRGVAALNSSDHFGVTGTFQYLFNAGDNVEIKYYVNNVDNGSSSLTGTQCHIGMVKL
ncbi:hypothetical protein [Winogradskyella psychrotolerans]|uniref:hypothetical protein n=1 Tax=Winogradskyella psychrotolerans TaxID=1344585 RepID=UPI001C067C9E|nr:hypothetical protein [Winogradskyella psychrotolerans]MBU2926612.1 hypothetical protein [Winogradskyella psychrotolerans]